MKFRILNLVACFSFGVLAIVVLFYLSPRINSRKNGFIRLFPPHKIKYIRDIKIHGSSLYFAGTNSSGVFIGNTSYSSGIVQLNQDLKLDTLMNLKYSLLKSKFPEYLRIHVDSPGIYIAEGITPAIWLGKFDNGFITQSLSNNYHFLDLTTISGSSWIVRTYDSALKQTVLVKQGSDLSGKTAKYILEKQEDGFYSTDGLLEYDRNTHLLFYIYYYKNVFVCLDTNLTQVYSSRTIDTISHSSLKILYLAKGKFSSLQGGAILVNKSMAATGGNLFVHSGLLANNENKYLFDHASVIDLYNEKNGNYMYSFYISDFQIEKMTKFIVVKNMLFALYTNYIVLYQLDI